MMKPKRILIIAPWYAPLTHPRAHRWTAITKHWAKEGHEVHVVTNRGKRGVTTAFESGVWVHRTGYDALKAIWINASKETEGWSKTGLLKRILMLIYQNTWQKIYYPDDTVIWRKSALRVARKLLNASKFDALISVSLPFTSHTIGRTLKTEYPDLIWMADVGDPFSLQAQSVNNRFLFSEKSRADECDALEKADRVITTTDAAKEKYGSAFGTALIPKIRVVPPLLHPVPAPIATPHTRTSPEIHLGYFGTFYRSVRPPDPLLRLAQKTRETNHFPIVLHVFGRIPFEFESSLKRERNIVLHGNIPRSEVINRMRQMDALIHVGNIGDSQLPSKAVEYMATGLPVVHLAWHKNDPFERFWGEQPGLFCLQYKEKEESEAVWENFRRWLRTIQSGELKFSVDAKRLSTFSIEAIAEAYFEHLFKDSVYEKS